MDVKSNKALLEIPQIKIKLEKEPKVLIAIITKDNTHLLFNCLDSIMVNREEDFPYKNIVIAVGDTGSNFDSREKIKRYLRIHEEKRKNDPTIPSITFFNNLKYHFSTNNNYVVKEMLKQHEDIELLLFMNNDTKFINNNISQFAQIFTCEFGETIGCLGSQLLFQNQMIQHQGIYVQRNLKGQIGAGHLNMHTFNYNYQIKEVVANTGAMLCVKKDDFLEIGGFDESLGLFQDLKLGIELLKMGKKNYVVNSALSYHFESSTRKDDKRKDNEILRRDLMSLQPYLYDAKDYINKYMYGIKI